MIKMIVQKKTITNIVKDNYRKALSIQFSLGGFSFCIFNKETKEVQHLTDCAFEQSVSTPEALLEQIELLCEENTRVLEQQFEQVTVIHQNNLSTLVPLPLFDEKEINTYLEYNIKTLPTDFVAFDTLAQLEINNVYIPYVNINNFFFQKFGTFDYKHHTTVLIDKLIAHAKNNSEKQFFVNVNPGNFDIVVIHNSKLLFCNTFTYYTKEDFIYYILFTAEQLELNPETLKLVLMGTIEKNSELYQLAYEYIRNINFIQIDSAFFDLDETISNHTNYITTP